MVDYGNNICYSMFHNIDAGLLFASDSRGKLYYFDLNSLSSKDVNLPTLEFHVSKAGSI